MEESELEFTLPIVVSYKNAGECCLLKFIGRLIML